MDIFYSLARYLDHCQGERFTKISLSLNAPGSTALCTRELQCKNITTLEYKYDGSMSGVHANDPSTLKAICDTAAMLSTLVSRRLRHLTFSGKSLAEYGALDMMKLWGQRVPKLRRLADPNWVSTLETLSLINIELNKASVREMLQLSVKLRLVNVAFIEDSIQIFEFPHRRRLRSVDVSGLILVADETIPRYDRAWVVGSEMEAAATVKKYGQHIREPLFLKNIPHVPPKDLERYILSGGPSPLRLDNMWTMPKYLALGNGYHQ